MRQSTISQLAMRKRAKQGLGALGRWAAGGAITAKSPEEDLEEARVKTIQAHRESILWSLQSTLAKCGQYQSSMMEIRLQREVEKSKSVLYKTRTTMPSIEHGGMDDRSSADRALQDYRGTSSHAQDESAAIEQQLDPEQLQLFAQENQDMLKQYEDQLDKVRYVASSRFTVYSTQLTEAQRCREVALGSLGAAVHTLQPSRDPVGAHRTACGGLFRYHGEHRERKQGTQEGNGEKEHSAKGLLRHNCLLHVPYSVGSVHMTDGGYQELQRSAAHEQCQTCECIANPTSSTFIAHCQEGFARNSKCVHTRSAVWPLQTHKPQRCSPA